MKVLSWRARLVSSLVRRIIWLLWMRLSFRRGCTWRTEIWTPLGWACSQSEMEYVTWAEQQPNVLDSVRQCCWPQLLLVSVVKPYWCLIHGGPPPPGCDWLDWKCLWTGDSAAVFHISTRLFLFRPSQEWDLNDSGWSGRRAPAHSGLGWKACSSASRSRVTHRHR